MRGSLLSGEAARPCVAACCRARLISEFREFNEFRDVRAMPATNQVSDVVPLNRAARSLTSLISLISLNSLLAARYHDAPKLFQAFSVFLSLSQPCVAVRGSLASEGLQMWCEMIVPWMGHTKTYFPFAASEFRAADAPLSRQAKFVVRSRKMWCQVEVWLDGGVLGRTSPFRRTSLVPQIAAYHNKEPNLLSEGRQIQRSANFESMGCT